MFVGCLKETLVPNKCSVNVDSMFYCYDPSKVKDWCIFWRKIDIQRVR